MSSPKVIVARSLPNYNGQTSDYSWVFDTIASHHFTKFNKLLFDHKSIANEEMSVEMDGVTFPVVGKGTVKMSSNGIIYNFNNDRLGRRRL